MSDRSAQPGQSERVLPAAVGLCPVHSEEFYMPLTLPLASPLVRCPEPGCEKYLMLYVLSGTGH